LATAAGSPTPSEITPAWTFDGKWDPEETAEIRPISFDIKDGYVLFNFNQLITIIGKPVLKSRSGVEFTYISGAGSDTIRFDCARNFSSEDLRDIRIENKAEGIGTLATVKERNVNFSVE
jgi:hypothetical protein